MPAFATNGTVERESVWWLHEGNRALRAAILLIADNLIKCNDHFGALASRWRLLGKDPRDTHVKVAMRFCRIAYHMVAGRQVFHHPCLRTRSYILEKLIAFHVEHETPYKDYLQDINYAINQMPQKEHAAEAKPLADRLQEAQDRGRKGPQPLSEIIAIVLARLGVGAIQSTPSGDPDLT